MSHGGHNGATGGGHHGGGGHNYFSHMALWAFAALPGSGALMLAVFLLLLGGKALVVIPVALVAYLLVAALWCWRRAISQQSAPPTA